MIMNRPIYKLLAIAVSSRLGCANAPERKEWASRWSDRIEILVKQNFPSGSGFDNGTTLDLYASTGEKLVFTTSFHHMDEGGSYDGWSDHSVIVTPSLVAGYHIRVTGRNRNDIKTYMYDLFSNALDKETDFTDYEEVTD